MHHCLKEQKHQGVNIHLKNLNEANVKKVHSKGQLIGVWIDAKLSASENNLLWNKVFKGPTTVDFFYSDKPLEAMSYRDSL